MLTRILVVDDEPQVERLVLQRFRRQIRSGTYDFVFAFDGVDALEKLAGDPTIDMVLSDINMPKMDGLTLLTRLNEIEKNLKTVMVSAYSDMSNIRTAMNRGAYDFVTKPIDFKDLETTIDKTVREVQSLKLAALAQEELSRLHQDLNVANEIQQSILPKNFSVFPETTGLRMHAAMFPARDVGGDFYDFFWIDENRIALMVGDVSGKGIPAALFMAISRTLLKAIALKGETPGESLAEANRLLSRDNPRSMFVTVFYGVLDIRSRRLEYANGGHNFPLLRSAGGETRFVDGARCSALGVVEDLEYPCDCLELEPGSVLVLYTDGITEATDGDLREYSEQRLVSSLERRDQGSSKEILEGIVEDVREFVDGASQSDDLTALVIQHVAGPGDREHPIDASDKALTIRIKNQIAELRRVEAALEPFAELHQIPAAVITAIDLALDEIVTNIVSHAYEDQEVHFIDIRVLLAGGSLKLMIEDDGVAFDPLESGRPDTSSRLEERPIGGLGIHLVRNVMDELSYEYRDGRNRLILTKQLEED